MVQSEDRKVAKDSVLLRNLPDRVVDALLSDAVSHQYSRAETVFLQGEKAQFIHIVVDGWVKLYRVAPNGNEAIVNVFTRSHSFGEAVSFKNGDYPVSAEAVTDCTLLLLPARSLVAMMKEEPDLCIAALASTFQHLHEMVSHLEQIKARTGAQRVADFLLDLSNCETGSCMVTLPYDKILIAGRLGMKPESLSRAFAKLQKVGVKIARNHAMISDIDALKEYTRADPASGWRKAQ
ncbi:Crp/Fnr family transcriptional regulator [Litoreibacter arenae]|uniref:Transcriptional regulator, Crp/Fnr family n=1 Tax=Litoreibacter arenae DSM 19593 TaxID=1123360 RepID=S9QB12_9RHOB|nr:Crp/Fnr family transcriptional regulator [Litoreibacter arenae]EPX78566.1 transcriptional regulator, Crp/Fnr family [Litoreibacter arenae DSM 19593]